MSLGSISRAASCDDACTSTLASDFSSDTCRAAPKPRVVLPYTHTVHGTVRGARELCCVGSSLETCLATLQASMATPELPLWLCTVHTEQHTIRGASSCAALLPVLWKQHALDAAGNQQLAVCHWSLQVTLIKQDSIQLPAPASRAAEIRAAV
jgi:hypothetical protein